MPAYKDKAKGTWYASFYYEDWTGKKVKKMKRGFPTKREALEWERTFLQQQTADLEMTFENFVAVYVADMKGRIKENTWGTKEHILYKKLVPYFGKRKMCDIHSKEVIAWQNEMLGYRDKNGKPYSPVYLKTLHNQLSAVFNHAVRHYNLKVNPAAQAGNMGKPKGREMLFWTKAEYLKFAEAMMDKPLSYYAFEMLYWCGVREGELLALTPGDFDFEKQTVTISKSYQRIKGKDVITDPKTPKSNRVIQMPAFLCEEMRDYMGLDIGGDDYITKPFKLAVFLSRVNALLRRSENYNQAQDNNTALKSNGIEVQLLKQEVTKDGVTISLTASEYKLLCLFMENPNIVLSPEQILSKLWDCDEKYIDNNTLTVYIRRLRTKIEDNPADPQKIVTVRRMGYKWNETDRGVL